MPDSFTPILGFRQMPTGSNNNTWGTGLNSGVHQLVEDSIAGREEIIVAAGDTTLVPVPGAQDTGARKAIIRLSGVPGATRNLIIPNASKLYVIENLTNAIQNVKTAAGTALAIGISERKFVLCDGSDGVFAIADTLGGLDASAFAKIASRNIYTAGNADLPREFVDGVTITLDTALANVWFGTLAGDRTIAFTNATDGSWIDLYTTQDATGGRDITWPANIVWEGGEAPEFNGTPNTTDLVQLRYIADSVSWFGRHGGTFSATGAISVVSATFTHNESNVGMYERAGSPVGAVTLTVRVPSGVTIFSTSPATAALDFAGFAAGSILNIIVEGVIHGCGGDGGDGGIAAGLSGNDPFGANGTMGFNGGSAIRLPSAAGTVNITNTTGRIRGGGGGGGGGGASSSTNVDNAGAGGGGGGGAGGGRGGTPASCRATTVVATGARGAPGGVGKLGDFGLGGNGVNTGTANGGNGGPGGTWGTVGTVGESPTTQAYNSDGGAGGTGGKAVDLNGSGVVIGWADPASNSAPQLMGAVS